MMKSLLIMSALLLSMGAAEARSKKTAKTPKMSREEAKELCLTSKGANISKKELKKCTSKVMRAGKV